MANRAMMPPAVVAEVKKGLANGFSQSDVAEQIGVSQSTVSNIMRGRGYGDVPWPNGNTGSMKDAYPQGVAKREYGKMGKGKPGLDGVPDERGEWCDLAEVYSGLSVGMQGDMFRWVNKLRAKKGDPPIPDIAVEYEVYLAAPEENEHRRTVAMAAEQKRRAMIQREYDMDFLDRQSAKREKFYRSFGDGYKRTEGPIEPVPPPPLMNPARYETMPASELKRRDPQHPALIEAIREKDSALLEAACCVLKMIPAGQWRESSILLSIKQTAEWVRVSPAARAAGAEKMLALLG